MLFTINMILEEKMDSLDMIWGAESKRDYYHVAALIASFWQENLEVLSDELINKYIYMTEKNFISALMKDYRYFERFGGLSIGRLAKEVEEYSTKKTNRW